MGRGRWAWAWARACTHARSCWLGYAWTSVAESCVALGLPNGLGGVTGWPGQPASRLPGRLSSCLAAWLPVYLGRWLRGCLATSGCSCPGCLAASQASACQNAQAQLTQQNKGAAGGSLGGQATCKHPSVHGSPVGSVGGAPRRMTPNRRPSRSSLRDERGGSSTPRPNGPRAADARPGPVPSPVAPASDPTGRARRLSHAAAPSMEPSPSQGTFRH